jgi:enoyl-CoA hydratase/carnithine racemase
MSYQNLLVETRDGVAVVTVNRPDKLNALNDARWRSSTPPSPPSPPMPCQ